MASPSPRRHQMSLERRHQRTGLLFITPAFMMILFFVLIPALGAIYLSTTEWFLVGTPTFVGLANYVGILTSSAFGQSLIITLVVAVGVALPGSLLALVLALLLTRVGKGISVYQTIVYLPLVVPSVVSSIVWGALYVGNGVINSILGVSIPWLTHPVLAVISILVLMIWTNSGYYAILVFAGLQDIPREVIEAASMDGASALQRFRYILFPLLRPVLLFVGVIATTDALTLFVQPYLLTQGGPGSATQTLSLLIYQTAFRFGDVGKASAMAVVLLVLAIGFAIAQFRALRSSDE